MEEENSGHEQSEPQERGGAAGAAAAQGGGERLAQVQLAALTEASEAADAGGHSMSETQRAALMSSLARKEDTKQRCSSSGVPQVNPKAVKELQELLLLPAAAAEAALRQSGGDVHAAVKQLILSEDRGSKS